MFWLPTPAWAPLASLPPLPRLIIHCFEVYMPAVHSRSFVDVKHIADPSDHAGSCAGCHASCTRFTAGASRSGSPLSCTPASAAPVAQTISCPLAGAIRDAAKLRPAVPRRFSVVLNPASGSSVAKHILDEVVAPIMSVAGIELEIFATQGASDARKFVAGFEAAAGFEGIVVMGATVRSNFDIVLDHFSRRFQLFTSYEYTPCMVPYNRQRPLY